MKNDGSPWLYRQKEVKRHGLRVGRWFDMYRARRTVRSLVWLAATKKKGGRASKLLDRRDDGGMVKNGGDGGAGGREGGW